jgi:sec-independent protein translocase protein TatA
MTSMPPLAIFGMGHWEILLILLLVLVLFGSRLPGAMKSLGASIREFKKGVKDGSGSPDDAPDARLEDRRDQTAPPPRVEDRERERERRN